MAAGSSGGAGLRVRGLCKRFGPVLALDNVGFEVPEGSVVGLIGPNGAGKTTTMRIILRILQPDAGGVEWDGRPVDGLPHAFFGYLPEERGLYPRMRVRDQLAFFGALYGLTSAAIRRAIDEMAGLLEMGDILDRRIEELSKGNAQKVQFAAACLHGPRLLVLDEPFSGLDPVNTRLFKAALRHLRERGATVLFSSHLMDDVEELCDGLCLIARGRVRLFGSVDDVRRATGRRVLRVAWQPPAADEPRPDGVPGAGWVERLKAQGFEAELKPHGVWELSYAADTGVDPDALLEQARQAGRLRLFEVTYPSLEDVYVAVVGHEAGRGQAGAEGKAGAGGKPEAEGEAPR